MHETIFSRLIGVARRGDGFYTHMCVLTSAREALVRGFDVFVDPDATGARDLYDELLGRQTAYEVGMSALLHLSNMGATIKRSTHTLEQQSLAVTDVARADLDAFARLYQSTEPGVPAVKR